MNYFKKVMIFRLLVVAQAQLFCQVNLQTGSATFDLPMFSWQDDKSRLNANLALIYNSVNGLKVSDVASELGQGWNLQAGGVIVRMQVGEPDEVREPFNFFQYKLQILPEN